MTEEDRDLLDGLDGIFVGQFNQEELAAFHRAVDEGKMEHSYEGVSGFMGLATARKIYSW